MKISEITIKNFRSFKSESINFQDLMVLIGENNTGKSNILKAMERKRCQEPFIFSKR